MPPPDVVKLCADPGNPAAEASCRYLAGQCIDKATRGEPLTVEMPDGTLSKPQPTLDACLGLSSSVTKILGPLPRFRHTTQQTAPPPPPQTPPPPVMPATAQAGADRYLQCDSVGPYGSEKNIFCRELIDICLQSTSPYTLPYEGGVMTIASQQQCLNTATAMASMLSRGRSTPSTVVATTNPATWNPDGRTQIAKPFTIRTVKLAAAGQIDAPRLLVENEGEICDIAKRNGLGPIAYAVSDAPQGKKWFSYRISWWGGTNEGAIEFYPYEKVVNIEFRITMHTPAGSIKSIEIVRD